MTPRALRAALASRGDTWPIHDAELLAAVESRADARPGDPFWTSMLLACLLLHEAPSKLPEGLVRDELVRFDGLSATWTCHDLEGAPFLCRVPRTGLSPVQHRLLARDARAIQPLVAGLVLRGDSWVAPLPGNAVSDDLPEHLVPRFLATWLHQLDGWFSGAFAPLLPHEEELREVGGRARIISLTPGPARLDLWFRHLAITLKPTGPCAPLVRGWVELPPASPAEAAAQLRSCLRDDLAAQLTDLRRRRLERHQADRRQRLGHWLERLSKAVPVPVGKATVGFDLDGHPTHVTATHEGIEWGPTHGGEVLFEEDRFKAAVARRFLRACAVAPGADRFVEHLSRWVGAGLRVRTLRLLLEHTA